MKFRDFWDVAPCSHIEVDWCFRDAYYLHHQGDEEAGCERRAGYIGVGGPSKLGPDAGGGMHL
jgi:hypothetical protein